MRHAHLERRDTVRLVDSRHVDVAGGAPHTFESLAADATAVADLVDLADVTSARRRAEEGADPRFPRNVLVGAVRMAHVINAAFTYPSGADRGGARFNDAEVGAWYASIELRTAKAEVAHHRGVFLREAGIASAELSFAPYLADVTVDAAVLDRATDAALLDPDDYTASRAFAARVRGHGVEAIAYPSARDPHGENIAALVPHVVQNVRREPPVTAIWSGDRLHWRR